MEFEVNAIFMSIESCKFNDRDMYKATFYIDGSSVEFFLADKHVDINGLHCCCFGDQLKLCVNLVKHPKVSNAYKLRLNHVI